MTTDELLAAAQDSDLQAFEALVRSQGSRLHRIALRVTGDPGLADDVLQETFLRILRVPERARPARGGAAWLARVTVRVAVDILRNERARHRREERYAKDRSQEMKHTRPGGAPRDEVLDRPIAEALAGVSPETRAAVWLHVVEGESVRDVAACLDSSRSAVSRRIRAGLEALRGSLLRRGIALGGAALLEGALRGVEATLSEALIDRTVAAGRMAMNAPAPQPDALDVALAGPVRPAPSPAVSAALVVICLGAVSGLVWAIFLRPVDRPANGVASAPFMPPSAPVAAEPVRQAPAARPAPVATPAREPTGVRGTVRDENGEPIAGADVYLTTHPPAADDDGMDAMLGRYFRPDYYRRSRVHRTQTDGEGRFHLAEVPPSHGGTLGAFRDGYSGVIEQARDEDGGEGGVVLTLGEGKTLAGKAITADGAPITDAVVTVTQAWSASNHIFRGAGLGLTDAGGRFLLGVGAAAVACHVRVSSDRHGQAFFLEVPVADGEVDLVFEEPARVEGTITWSDGKPAAGLTVRVTGRLPEPPVPVQRMGLRSTTVHDGLVASDGTYSIDGLHPRLHHDIFVVDASLGEREASMRPLSPRMVNAFRLEPAQVKVWDHAVPKPILVRGTIRTELTRTPVRQGRVAARKDGKPLHLVYCEAGEDGRFEMHLTSGAGEYVFHAQPPGSETPSSEEIDDILAERFGKPLRLAGGAEAEVDLTIFEPAVHPIRVIDAAGAPVKSIRTVFRARVDEKRTLSHDSPRSLDDTGRARFLLYFPAAEIWHQISSSDGGPAVETPRRESVPGVTLPEELVVLPRTCDLRAEILDNSGKPCTDAWIVTHVEHDDGASSHFTAHTDNHGLLVEKGKVRAGVFSLEFRSRGSRVLWRSRSLDGSSGSAINLGRVVLDGGCE